MVIALKKYILISETGIDYCKRSNNFYLIFSQQCSDFLNISLIMSVARELLAYDLRIEKRRLCPLLEMGSVYIS